MFLLRIASVRALCAGVLLAAAMPPLYAETAATDTLEEQQRLEDALWERREAAQFPVLAKDTVLAGIRMPKGTRLRLPGYASTGTDEWTQPPYLIRADFPQAVTWQGVRVKSLERGVLTPRGVFGDAEGAGVVKPGDGRSRFSGGCVRHTLWRG